MFNKKGGVELTTVIIIVVLVGALVIGIASALTSNLKNTASTGLGFNKNYLNDIYAQIPSNNEGGGDIGGGGNVFPPIISAHNVSMENWQNYHSVYDALVGIWNKIPDGGFAAVNHIHDDATEESAGFMSVADKIKLNNLTNYIHPETHPASMITGLSAVATSGNYYDLVNKPNSLPADGGNADTVGGKHASDFALTSHTHNASEVSIVDSNENFISTDVEGALNELFTSVSDGKNTVASAITDKGVPATGSDTFGELADKIGQIENNSDSFEIRAGDHILANLVEGDYTRVGLLRYVDKYYPIPDLRFVANANGTYKVRYSMECVKDSSNRDNEFYTKIYINGTATTTTYMGRVYYYNLGPREYTCDLTLQEGDVVELWGMLDSSDYDGKINYFYVQIDAPFLPDFNQ